MLSAPAIVASMLCLACQDTLAPPAGLPDLPGPMFSQSGTLPDPPLVLACWSGGSVGDTAFFRVTADGGTLLTGYDLEPSPNQDEVTFGIPYVPGGYVAYCSIPWILGEEPFDPNPITVTVTQIGTTALSIDSLEVSSPVGGTTNSIPPDTVATLSISPSNFAGGAFYHNGAGQVIPTVPDSIGIPDEAAVANQTLDTNVVYYREYFGVAFDDSTSGPGISAFLQEFEAVIVGGRPGSGTVPDLYIVRVPDPGPEETDVRGLATQMDSWPGVRMAFPMVYSGILPAGRYPSDGPGATRAQWLDELTASSPMWGFRSIRAPLAWGCETGTYSDDLVNIGIVDLSFDTPHADLAAADPDNIVLMTPPTALLKPSPTLADMRSHGTGVAGILAARGNNGSGTAGMLWRAQLHLYASGVGTMDVRNPALWLQQVFDSAAAQNVRIINLSSLYVAPQQIPYLEAIFGNYLDSGGFIVAAAGNNPFWRTSVDSLEAIDEQFAGLVEIPASIAALGRLMTGSYEDQILFVGASDFDNTLRFGSSYYSGASLASGVATVLAPGGANMLGLLNTDVPGNDSTGLLPGGTSFAAPYVAGLIGQLWTMVPELEPADVRRYVIEGAIAPTYIDAQAIPVLPNPISVTGFGNAYEIDAYSSLKMLSAERSDAPICGHAVSTRADPAAIILHKNTPVELSVAALDAIPGEGGGYGFSVAQGGRRIAAWRWHLDPPVGLIDHRGTAIGPLLTSVAQRHFLENGYADVVPLELDLSTPPPPGTTESSEGYRVTIVPEAGTSTTHDLALERPGTWERRVRDLLISPRADWVVVSAREEWSSGDAAYTWDLVPLVNPSASQPLFVQAFEDLGGISGPGAWSDDGSAVLVTQNASIPVQQEDSSFVWVPRSSMRLTNIPEAGSPSISPPVSQSGWRIFQTWLDNPSVLVSIEGDLEGVCRLVRRPWPVTSASVGSSVLGAPQCSWSSIQQSNLVSASATRPEQR